MSSHRSPANDNLKEKIKRVEEFVFEKHQNMTQADLGLLTRQQQQLYIYLHYIKFRLK